MHQKQPPAKVAWAVAAVAVVAAIADRAAGVNSDAPRSSAASSERFRGRVISCFSSSW